MPDPAVPREPLFAQVLNRRTDRRTDRRAYGAARPVAAADLARLNASVAGLPIVFVVAGRVDAPPAERAQIESIRTLARLSQLATESAAKLLIRREWDPKVFTTQPAFGSWS